MVMEYRNLGNSGLKPSVVSLGGDTFGRDIDEATTRAVIDHALGLGINYIDTADVYGRGGGRSEEFIGRAIQGRRSRVIVATKFGVAVGEGAQQFASKEGLGARAYVMKAVDASLKRLGTDYIDLYQFHMPDPLTPMEETLRAMDDTVHAGKVRFIGGSNLPGWELCEALWVSRSAGLKSFVAVQPRYNLIDRHCEEEVVPCCQAYGVGVIPWYPLAGGFLTGKYQRGAALPAGTRFESNPGMYAWLLTESNFDQLEKLQRFAAERRHTVAELAIAWLTSHPWITTVIAGVTRPEQVAANVAAAAWHLTEPEMGEIDRLTGHRPYTAPRPRRYALPPGYVDEGPPGR
jgi:aryl-alcohol dehydrogenase-like predicted oxidoreductase